MPTTPGGLPYPAASDSPNGPSQIQALATAIETGFVRPVASASARTALSGISTGLLVAEKDTGNLYVKVAAGWQQINTSVSDTGWLNLTPAVGTTAGTRGEKYRIVQGVCYFSIGAIDSNGWTAGQIVTTFPAGARPAQTIGFTALYGGPEIVQVDLATSGQLTVLTNSTATTNVGLVLSGAFPVG